MMRLFLMFFLVLGSFKGLDLNADDRGSSAPYISGDSFRVNCDFTYDELNRSLNPAQVESGNTVFVKTDYLEEFFTKIHPWISCRYILVTHNSDYHVPGNFGHFLDDEKIIAWFGQNVDECNHPKMIPIPIGAANRRWGHGNIAIFKQMQALLPNMSKNILLYMNFTPSTYMSERPQVAAMFRNKPYCVVSGTKEMTAYLTDLGQSMFVLSPRGNGQDCHRTWEALMMGAYPIVRTSYLDSMYDDLPVVIIKDWEEIDEQFLQEKYEEFQSRSFQMEKVYLDYWLKKIESYKSQK